MVAIEREADSKGLSYSQMMENAGQGLAEVVDERYPFLKPGPVLGLVGSGNNGGDTLVALDYLGSWGWEVEAYLAVPRAEPDPLADRVRRIGGRITDGSEDPDFGLLGEMLGGCSILLDGVLGTGIRLPLRGRVAQVLEWVGSYLDSMEPPPAVVAVDCPSGVDSDSGEAATQCIPAELTVTMAAMKAGLLKFPAYEYVGALELVGIGLTEQISSWRSIRRFIPDEAYVIENLPARRLDAHKGTFGTALVIAGSRYYTGAALLAGQAAYRSGAGLVTLGVPEQIHTALAGHFLEATWLPLPESGGGLSAAAAEVVVGSLERPTALLVGPGFGVSDPTKGFVDRLFSAESAGKLPPTVVDADGLKLLAGLDDWTGRLPAGSVFTPHPGEMSILTGLPVAEIQKARLDIAESYARRWGAVVVLKGAFTVIASPGGGTALIPVATPALARAGTGDVLAGLVVGLMAQKLDSFNSAVIAAWIHAQAGLRAAAVLGSTSAVMAGDILQGVVDIMADVSE
jgi:NAD(P)H-hydrate epimerase